MASPSDRSGTDRSGDPSDRDPSWVEPGGDDGEEGPPRERPTPAGGSRRTVHLVALALVALGLLAAVLAYRSHHRKQVLAKGMARAAELIRLDTAAGYRAASEVLEPLVPIDASQAGTLRAQALAMLAADYRNVAAGSEAERLLDEPERAAEIPAAASLARAALALGSGQGGSAVTSASRPGTGALGKVIQGRVALLAGNPPGAATFAAEGLALDPTLPAALALSGDGLRRTGKPEAARDAYRRALAASPNHPRAAYGMAKLALSGKADAVEAMAPLERLLADREGTPAPERGRAALHLAALQGRAGDRAGVQRTLDASGTTGADRRWLERAIADEELSRTGFRVADGAPAGLLSASDDDPYVPPPPPAPPSPEPTRKVVKKADKKAPAKKKPAGKGKPAAKGGAKPGSKPSPKAKPGAAPSR